MKRVKSEADGEGRLTVAQLEHDVMRKSENEKNIEAAEIHAGYPAPCPSVREKYKK